MYETSFGFSARPFAASPQSRCYYSGGPVELARKTITECIERSEGPAVLIGPAGSGKSLVCYLLAQQFQNAYQVVMLADARIDSRKSLLQNVLFDLGLAYQGMDEGELRLALIDHLDPKSETSTGLLLLVDEADSLSVELLEEIRMITNLVRDGESRVRLVLAGGPELETNFADPRLDTFNQRIARRCYLHTLNEHQTAEYVKAQIEGVGGSANGVFTDAALAAVFTASDGSPRIINQVCDHALLLNSVSGSDSIDADAISEAWSDLQQMPEPWEDASAEPTPSFIEFGELSVEPETSQPQAEQMADAPPEVATEQVIEEALSNLDSIQSEVERVSQEDDPSPASEPAVVEPVAEATPPSVAEEAAEEKDPFDDDFAEDEPVIDPYSAATASPPVQKEDVEVASNAEASEALEIVQPQQTVSLIKEVAAESPQPETESPAPVEPQAEKSSASTDDFFLVDEQPEAEEVIDPAPEQESPEASSELAENVDEVKVETGPAIPPFEETSESEDESFVIVDQTPVAVEEPAIDATETDQPAESPAAAEIEPVAESTPEVEVNKPVAEVEIPAEESAEAIDEPVAEAPMLTVQLDAIDLPSAETTPACDIGPMHTVQIDAESLARSIQENQDFFSIDDPAESPAAESTDDVFVTESPAEEEQVAEQTPGQWPLAEPMAEEDESVFAIEGDEATVEAPVSVMQNVQAEPPAEEVEEEEAPPTVAVDDRDMIVVEEEPAAIEVDDRPQARRQEYRQLFARLRKLQQ